MGRVLIVDDSRAVRTLLARTMRELGYEVSEAANGKEALDSIEASAEPLELVLLDWNMPEMDGLELLKILRAHPRHGSVAVIMVTSETEMTQVARALEAGATEYVMKPFTADVVAGKLRLAGLLA